MHTLRRILPATAILALALLVVVRTDHVRSQQSPSPGPTRNRVLQAELNQITGQAAAASPLRTHVSGAVIQALLDATQSPGTGAAAAVAPAVAAPGSTGTVGCQNTFPANGGAPFANVRVNQDCSLRRQAEEVVVVNPTNPNNLIAGQNDSRIGFNHCGYDWSNDGGHTWGDQLPPFYQFIMGDGHTADACSDPTATYDANGNAYVGGVLFDVNAAASAFVVTKSNAGINGSFYHTPNAALSFQTYRDNPLGVVASDNDPNIFHDKEFIVADANAVGPKKNNVYATWTRFDVSGCLGTGIPCHSPIYFSQSTNGGATWSPGVEISGANPAICTAFSGEANPNACDQDQGSQPVVGPDGTIYVSFANGNTPLININQVLVVKCPVANNCASSAGWTAPVKVDDLITSEPFGPVAATGCPPGRQCLPPNGYRMDDFVEVSISVDSAGKLYVVYSDNRNAAPTCSYPTTAAAAVPPCNHDVFYRYSTDGGATWSSTKNVTAGGQFGQTAQWMPWSAVFRDGSALAIAFYDRSYGTCETTGCNDITLATVASPATASPAMTYTRITTSSMPNLIVANNPIQAGFLGDYMWVSTDAQNRIHIAWADTRGLNGTVEEDIYYAQAGGCVPTSIRPTCP